MSSNRRTTPVTCRIRVFVDNLFGQITHRRDLRTMQSIKSVVASVSPHWALIAVASIIGIAAASVRAFESEESKGMGSVR